MKPLSYNKSHKWYNIFTNLQYRHSTMFNPVPGIRKIKRRKRAPGADVPSNDLLSRVWPKLFPCRLTNWDQIERWSSGLLTFKIFIRNRPSPPSYAPLSPSPNLLSVWTVRLFFVLPRSNLPKFCFSPPFKLLSSRIFKFPNSRSSKILYFSSKRNIYIYIDPLYIGKEKLNFSEREFP